MKLDVKEIHNISNPGSAPQAGDVVEVECVGGFVCEVDPVTREVGLEHERFLARRTGARRQPIR